MVYYIKYSKAGEVRGCCTFSIYGINPFLNYKQIYEASAVETESISQFIITGYNEMTKQEYKRLIGEV